MRASVQSVLFLCCVPVALSAGAPGALAAQQSRAPVTVAALRAEAHAHAASALPGIAYLERELDSAEIRFLFQTLRKLPRPADIADLQALTAYEPLGERRFWSARIAAGLQGFVPDSGLAGLVDAAVTLTRIRAAYRWGAPQFSGKTYRADAIPPAPAALRVRFDYSGADRLLDYLDNDSAGPAEAAAVAALPAWQAMLEHRGARAITPERLLVYLDHAHRRDPSHLLYKWVNPTGFWNLAGVSLHVPEFRRVLASLRWNEAVITARTGARVAEFVPAGASVDATVMFLFSRFADGWAAGSLLGIDLEHFGDDYAHLARVITHELAHQAQNELALPLPDLTETVEDQQLLTAMRGVFREGTASYISPVRYDVRPPDALDRDFGVFTSVFRTLYARGDLMAADTLIRGGLEGAGAFYSMGAYMAATIDSGLGRATLEETLRTGPVDFFVRYIEVYRGPRSAVPAALRFPPALEERFDALGRRYPVQVLRDVAHAVALADSGARRAALEGLATRYVNGPSGILFDILSSEFLIGFGDYRAASARLVKGLTFAPNREEIANAMAYRFMLANAPDEALAMLNLYVSYAPESAVAYANRCELYRSIGEVALAWGDCRQALRLNPESGRARHLLDDIERRLDE